MRVLHLTDDVTGMSGVRSYLLQLGDALAPLGVECELFTPRRSGGPVRDHVTRWAGRGYARELAERIHSDRPDVVHAHNLWMRLSPLPLRAARGAGLPVAMTVHDYHLVCPRKWMITPDGAPCATGFGPRCLGLDCFAGRRGWAWRPYNAMRWLKVAVHRGMLRSWVDLFIAPSEHLAGWLRRSLRAARVVRLANFASEPAGAREPSRNHDRLLFAGRLGPEKGVDILLRSLAMVAESWPQVSLEIAGDGPERSRLVDLAARLGLAGRVVWTGRLAPDELEGRYREAGVFVLPTLWMENCPVAVLEAMSHGLPVVATRIGGLPELVEDGVTGSLVERADVRGLAAALLALLAKPERATTMGRAGRRRFLDRHTAAGHAQSLRGLYEGLVATEGGGDTGGRALTRSSAPRRCDGSCPRRRSRTEAIWRPSSTGAFRQRSPSSLPSSRRPRWPAATWRTSAAGSATRPRRLRPPEPRCRRDRHRPGEARPGARHGPARGRRRGSLRRRLGLPATAGG